MTLPRDPARIGAMRKIEDARDARACVKAARAAGLSLGAWARRHGVDGRSLHAWSVNMARASSTTAIVAKPRLVELVPTSAPRGSARYILRVSDAVVEVGDDFCDETLARVVRVLRAC
ncbi:MAG TPA: hypothetical protein VFW85_06370 [Gaiellaceae bacterium]|nr:hypothetical protein [Gaiellaceae bacterium]